MNGIRLDRLNDRHGLTPARLEVFREAASVCLSRHHQPPAVLVLEDNGVRSTADLSWREPDERERATYANLHEAVEQGAYGCVLASIDHLRGLVAVRRADTGTGADYYVGPLGAGANDLEDCLRLEISGIDAGEERDVRRRLVEKQQQARDGQSSLPALAGVIGFRARLLLVADVHELA
jgi:hypothetical protein